MYRMVLSLRKRHASQRGFSLIELLIVIAIILIILSFALPKMNQARMHAQETGAMAALRTIYAMEMQYQSQFGQFATSLSQLGPPSSAGAAQGPSAAGLISAGLAGGTASGYNFTIAPNTTGYAVTAVPKIFGNTGRRTFYTDETGAVRENWTQEPATVNSPEVK